MKYALLFPPPIYSLAPPTKRGGLGKKKASRTICFLKKKKRKKREKRKNLFTSYPQDINSLSTLDYLTIKIIFANIR